MTISSVLVGAVAGDSRQTQSTLSADALQAGAWSAIDWEFDPVLTLGGIFGTAAIVMLVGTAASFDVLFRKPLSTLRSQ